MYMYVFMCICMCMYIHAPIYAEGHPAGKQGGRTGASNAPLLQRRLIAFWAALDTVLSVGQGR